jgi:hypothetical protein
MYLEAMPFLPKSSRWSSRTWMLVAHRPIAEMDANTTSSVVTMR